MGQLPPAQPWETFEVVLRGGNGELDPRQRPFSEELLGGDGDETKTALQKMLLLQSHGWPAALPLLKDKNGKPLIDKADAKDATIWILKAKPSCWRLYFHVYQRDRHIVYLYAKCKKKTSRDPADSTHARSILNRIGGPRGAGIARFRFPAG